MTGKKTPTAPITVDEKISRKITQCKNVDDTDIIITESKLENILIKHKETLHSGSDWKTPLGLIVAIITFFLTGGVSKDFFLGVSVWKAIFILVLAFSIAWLCRSLYLRYQNKDETIDSLIRLIKNEKSNNV